MMGFVPPETPDRPDWMDDETWRRFLKHESETILRHEEQQAASWGWICFWIGALNVLYFLAVLASGGKQ